jgi:hypothetical protein
MIRQIGPIALATIAVASCTSVGQVGVMTRPSADPSAVIREAHRYHEIGPAKGTACRYFLLAIVPWGESTASRALDKALDATGGDALLNVTVYSSLYTFVPYFNIFAYTCTSVEGTAIDYLPPPTPLPPSAPAAKPYEPAPTQ